MRRAICIGIVTAVAAVSAFSLACGKTPTQPTQGTFRVSGTVTSEGLPEWAEIEIVSGTVIGLRNTTTNGNGHYSLCCVAGVVELRASAYGFALSSLIEPQVHRILVTGNMTNDFDLRPLVMPTDVSGSWILTLSASPSCRASLPEVAREREFGADIAQQSTRFQMTLTSPTLANGPASLGGRIFGQVLSFSFNDDTSHLHCDDFQTMLERISPTQWLAISHNGGAQGTVTGSKIQATLDDSICYWEPLPMFGAPTATCDANDHGMVLRRR